MSLAELFYSKQIFRRTPARLPRPHQAAPRRFKSSIVNRKSPFLLEPLEPRLLLAADPTLLPLLTPPLAGDPTPSLRVTTVTPTPSGVSVRFNQPVDPTALNLYDTETGGLGPADVTVVGATTGPARGSLDLDSKAQNLTFQHTGCLLPPDTYTVTLRSAANGFRTPAGDLLDGDGDGTPGDAFGRTFAVAPSSARSLSIPDLVRGPGQPLDAGLPLTLNDGTGITQVAFTLAYDPALLAITGVTPGATVPQGTQITTDLATLGKVTAAINAPTALPAGLLDLARLQGEIPHTAPYKAAQSSISRT